MKNKYAFTDIFNPAIISSEPYLWANQFFK